MEALLAALPDDRRARVEARLECDIIAWLTTVRPSGQPDTVPVWYLWTEDTIVIYSRPQKLKQRNLAANPKVSLVLDDTKQGWDVVRIEGCARLDPSRPSLAQTPAYVEKYAKGIRAIGYAGPAEFAADFSEAIVVTPTRVRG
ncbi:MAG TPA: TIGR03667 family PPOX class F420-dependent oxidoreductase [Actinopolymorphaceae bacterium]|nr:TIGR03667 family PPOX class F420-dependent oxidoreductase [Actinopolymorphaceae bacterium]